MITKITGKLVRLGDNEAVLEVGPLEYEVFVPEFVRRQLQPEIGQTVSLRTIEYIEGNPQQGRMTPRLVGFMNEAEVEFFELICSVDGVGVRKALRAIVRPVGKWPPRSKSRTSNSSSPCRVSDRPWPSGSSPSCGGRWPASP